MKKNKIVVISGATATGKTKQAISLAKKYRKHCLEIVNFDSLLFYQELSIGSNKPSQKEMGNIPHHLIDIASAKNPINAFVFAKLAKEKIEEIHKKQAIPVLVGGSGFYLDALLSGTSYHPPSEEVIEKSNQLYQKSGITPFHEILKKNDPVNFRKLHPNDHYRIRRAVEYYWSTGKPFSTAISEKILSKENNKWNILHLYLSIEKQKHWEIIHTRSEKIIQQGLIEEVKELLFCKGFTGKERPLLSIGYKEVQEYLAKKIETKEQLIEKITISTRQLAKSQKTFFSRFQTKRELPTNQDKLMIGSYLESFLQQRRTPVCINSSGQIASLMRYWLRNIDNERK